MTDCSCCMCHTNKHHAGPDTLSHTVTGSKLGVTHRKTVIKVGMHIIHLHSLPPTCVCCRGLAAMLVLKFSSVYPTFYTACTHTIRCPPRRVCRLPLPPPPASCATAFKAAAAAACTRTTPPQHVLQKRRAQVQVDRTARPQLPHRSRC